MKIDNIFDSHAHYDDEAFSKDREKTIQKIKDAGVCCVVNASSDLTSSKNSVELSKKHNFFYAAVGIHPLNLENLSLNYLSTLEKLVKENKKIVAIGEIGLDYHTKPFNKENQIKIFKEQLELANKNNLPVIIHNRDADSDCFNLVKQYKPKGVIHCFSGNLELAKELINMSMYIGIGGVLTFKNAKKLVNVASNIPLENILLETDCPYMAPEPLRGTRCDSSMIIHTAKKLSELRNIPLEQVLNQTKENAKKLFRIG